MEITSDTRTINGYSEVAGIKIQYSASVKTDEQIDRITGSFIKDGVRVGSLAYERNGQFFMSVDKPGVITSKEDAVAIATQFFNDTYEMLNSQAVE